MRSVDSARQAWSLLEQQKSLSELRNLIARRDNGSIGTLRSVSWKAFLLFKDTAYDTWPDKLQHSRAEYATLRRRHVDVLQREDEVDAFADPLSDDSNSLWASLRLDEAARQEIFQDVERCMPDNLWFRQPETQNMLLDILFVWAKLNPDVAYRQGMHEVVAPILWAIEGDAIDQQTLGLDTKIDVVCHVCDADHIESDTFALFRAVMDGLKTAYAGPAPPSGLTPLQATAEPPIVKRSRRLIQSGLRKVDPELSAHLLKLDISPQLFLMRWIRLLFGREFPFDDALQIWDGLFAVGCTERIIDLTCLAMLLRIRWQLLEADYNTALTLLLRYPPLPPSSLGPTLVDDALYMSGHLDTERGSLLIKKHSGREPSPVLRPETPPATSSPDVSEGQRSPRSPSRFLTRHGRQSSGLDGVLHGAARGFYERSEQWGVNKAIREAVGDVRRNVKNLGNREMSHNRGNSTVSIASEEFSNNLQAIDDLQTRNRRLARMLQDAVEELWKQQKDAALKKSVDDEDVKAFTMAIAKVQLAQVYLDDSSLPLPADEEEVTQQEEPKKGAVESLKAADTRSNGSNGKSPVRQEISKPEVPPAVDRLEESQESTAISAKTETGASNMPLKETQSPTKSARPPLEQSSFSWMLGQDEAENRASPRKAFMSGAPFTSSHRVRTSGSRGGRSIGFLFGDEEDATAGSGEHQEGKAKQSSTDQKEDLFRLGALND